MTHVTACGDIQAAIDALDACRFSGGSSQPRVLTIPPGRYVLTDTVRLPYPSDMTVIAHGAKFDCTALDGLAFDCHHGATPEGNPKENFRWFGGRFIGDIDHTSNVAMRLRKMRNVKVSDVYMEGFQRGITFASTDSFYFADNFFRRNGYALHSDDWASDHTHLLSVHVSRCYFGHGSNNTKFRAAIHITNGLNDSSIRDCSVNFGGRSGDHGSPVYGVYIDRPSKAKADMRSLRLEGIRFENAGDYVQGIRINGAGPGHAEAIAIASCNVSVNGGDHVKGINLTNVRGLDIAGNKFGQNNGRTAIRGVGCSQVVMADSNVLNSAAVVEWL